MKFPSHANKYSNEIKQEKENWRNRKRKKSIHLVNHINKMLIRLGNWIPAINQLDRNQPIIIIIIIIIEIIGGIFKMFTPGFADGFTRDQMTTYYYCY